MPYRGTLQELLLWWVQPLHSKQDGVRLTHDLWLAPEAHQFRGTLADNRRQRHSVQPSRRRAGRGIQIRITIKPQQTHLPVITARAGQQTDDLRAIAAQNQHESA